MLSIASIQTTAFGNFAALNKAPAKKAPAFAYGLPGAFNALGGSELNWDPAGFLEGKSELEVNRYREAELTHGRVGMLASLGFLVQEKFHPLFSGDGGPAIDQIPGLPVWLWAIMGGGIAAAESYRINQAFRGYGQRVQWAGAEGPHRGPPHVGWGVPNGRRQPASTRRCRPRLARHTRSPSRRPGSPHHQ